MQKGWRQVETCLPNVSSCRKYWETSGDMCLNMSPLSPKAAHPQTHSSFPRSNRMGCLRIGLAHCEPDQRPPGGLNTDPDEVLNLRARHGAMKPLLACLASRRLLFRHASRVVLRSNGLQVDGRDRGAIDDYLFVAL